jgi:hypothetical protein
MSKILLVYKRSSTDSRIFSDSEIAKITDRITPDNIKPNSTRVIKKKGINILIFNPVSAVKIVKTSVCLGKILNNSDGWWNPKGSIPEGNYALFRSDEKYIELISDAVSSRTIWYYKDKESFIASTSQRAIVLAASSFVFNKGTIPWMISSGILGINHSWDKRIRQIPPNSKLLLNLSTWRSDLITKEIDFQPLDLKRSVFQLRLANLLDSTFENRNLAPDKWVIPLSGGVDSRGILLFLLRHKVRLNTITWGASSSVNNVNNDVLVAKKLAKRLNVKNKYFKTDLSNGLFEITLNRFLVAGEGRIDHIGGYLDGFSMWKELFEKGFEGIIRGDEGFGWHKVIYSSDVFYSLGINKIGSIKSPGKIDYSCIPDQVFHEIFNRRERESLATWRDRLYHNFRIPVILAALNDLKLSYIEICNPFLNHSIIEFARILPDKLRTNKYLFRRIVDFMSPEINYAKENALNETENIFNNKQVLIYIISELEKDFNSGLIPRQFLESIITDLKQRLHRNKNKRGIKSVVFKNIKALLPVRLKSILKYANYKVRINTGILAFRILIIIKMAEMLKEDSYYLKKSN